jgi:hypothetical protein
MIPKKASALVILAIVMGVGVVVIVGTMTATTNQTTLQRIVANPTAWLNKTITIEGYLSPCLPPGWCWPPFNWELSSSPNTTGVMSVADNGTCFGSNAVGVAWYNVSKSNQHVVVTGVVTAGRWTGLFANGTESPIGPIVYYINAENVSAA